MTRKDELFEIIKQTGNQNDVKARKLIEMICFQEERPGSSTREISEAAT